MVKKLTEEDFLQKVRNIHGDKYIYPSFETFPNTRTKIEITCPLHGPFHQVISSHLRKRGCPKCGDLTTSNKTSSNTTEFIERAIQKHGNLYSYENTHYVNNHTKVEIICLIHGSFWQHPQSHLACNDACVECRYTTEKFIKESMTIHEDKFLYHHTIYVSARKKLIITCPLHGDFDILPQNHLHNKGGCKSCMSDVISNLRSLTQEDFLQRSRAKHGNLYDYSLSIYKDVYTKVKIICPTHGIFEQFPTSHWEGYHCSKCNNASSLPQREIENFLFQNNISYKNNDRTILNPNLKNKTHSLELDIVITSHKLAIEYCGLYWHNENNITDNNYHRNKTLLAKQQGYTLLTIFGDEWEYKTDIIKSVIRHKLGMTDNIIYARKCSIEKLSPTIAKEFLNHNHLQGQINGKHYGLMHDGKLVQLITMGKSRFNHKYEWEILRICTLLNTHVVGGLSKLFSHIVNELQPNTIISYADLRYGEGLSYAKLGFERIQDSRPNYYYIDSNKKIKESRIKYQKHKLIAEGYDPNMTEVEIMLSRGFTRIWDCGNAVWIWRT